MFDSNVAWNLPGMSKLHFVVLYIHDDDLICRLVGVGSIPDASASKLRFSGLESPRKSLDVHEPSHSTSANEPQRIAGTLFSPAPHATHRRPWTFFSK